MRVAFVAILVFACAAVGCHVNIDANSARPASASATRTVAPGPTPAVTGNHETIALAEGKYEGDLVITGNHDTVTGAGYGKTIVKGRLLMGGSHNTVESLTIEGGGTVEGHHNDATNVEFHGDVTTGGGDKKKD